MDNILDFTNREQFYSWLKENCLSQKECYIFLNRGKIKQNTFSYIDGVEVALCFGWIDSTLTKIKGKLYQKFTPRKDNSLWTELNKERARRLIKLNQMTEFGLKVLPNLSTPFEIDKSIFSDIEEVLDIFKTMPPLYFRVRAYNLAFTKKYNPTLYPKSLQNFISNTKNNKLYGNWNDYGRLLNY